MNPLDRHTLVRESKLKYLHDDFVLVEEIAKDGSRLFPHTEQLPKILKAVEREFFEGIPSFYAKTDHRGDDRRKYMLALLSTRFCDCINSTREDGLVLFPVLRRDLVSRLSVIQRIEEPSADGVRHRFRSFVDGAFFPDVHMSGKRIALTSHFIQRFNERITNLAHTCFPSLFLMMYDNSGYVMRVNGRECALVLDRAAEADDEFSVAALTFDEAPDQFVFTTVLTANEIRSLEPLEPARMLDTHYDRHFPAGVRYNFTDYSSQEKIIEMWRRKIPHKHTHIDPSSYGKHFNWDYFSHHYVQLYEAEWKEGRHLCFIGNYHSTSMCFLDNEDLKTRKIEVPEDGP